MRTLVPACHKVLPLLVSRARTLPLMSPVKVSPESVVSTPATAENDRVHGWQLMYSLLAEGRWLIGQNCERLIACIPTLICDERNVEDIRKRDGDDPADSARYGLVSGTRLAGLLPGQSGSAAAGFSRRSSAMKAPLHASRFSPPLAEQIARQVTATDPTSRAIWFERLQSDARRRSGNAVRPRRW